MKKSSVRNFNQQKKFELYESLIQFLNMKRRIQKNPSFLNLIRNDLVSKRSELLNFQTFLQAYQFQQIKHQKNPSNLLNSKTFVPKTEI